MDCPELKVAADDFFQIHFTEVYKLDEFLQLDVAQLTHLLHQDKLTVRAEAQVRVYTSFKYIFVPKKTSVTKNLLTCSSVALCSDL